MQAVILAGGLGTRLRPYTTIIPKPLMPVGNFPILEIIIRQLKFYGFKEIIISTGYLSELVKTYFENGKKFGLNISYVWETKPLNTAGPLKLMKDLDNNFLVMNGDILTNLNFYNFFSFHLKKSCEATICVQKHKVSLDYGIIKLNNIFFEDYIEKPNYEMHISTGIYVFNKKCINHIRHKEIIGMPDFIKRIKKFNKKVIIIRHPMSYGDLKRQAVQRFATEEDLEKQEVTLEEREEYERHLREKFIIYSGFDIKGILKKAQQEAEIIFWNGGNNDFPFVKPDYQIVIADARRPGHEIKYFPSDLTVKLADLLIINKVDVVPQRNIEIIKKNLRRLNKKAKILLTRLKLVIDKPQLIKDKTVLCIEDGPTVTHGGLANGASFQAAVEFGAKKIVNPRKWATGLIKKTFVKYKHLKKVLPAVGYNKQQLKDLEETINRTKCEIVIISTPVDLIKILKIKKPTVKVNYEIEEVGPVKIKTILEKDFRKMGSFS